MIRSGVVAFLKQSWAIIVTSIIFVLIAVILATTIDYDRGLPKSA